MKKLKKFIAILICIFMLFSAVSAAVFAKDKLHYVVLGDSITVGAGLLNSKDACFGKIIADTCGFTYANHAKSGDTTSDLLDKLKKKKVINDVKKADIISISIGGNDFLSNWPIFMFEVMALKKFDNVKKVLETLYENLCSIIDTINGYNPDAVIIIETMYNPQTGSIRETYQLAADNINEAIYKYQKENPGEIEIIDVGTAFGDNQKYIASDAIHPSAEGNELIAKLTLEKLKELGLTDKTELVINTKGQTNQFLYAARLISVLGFIFNAMSALFSGFNQSVNAISFGI